MEVYMDNSQLRPSEIARRARHRRKRTLTAAFGGIILLFACIGVGICLFYLVSFGVGAIRNYAAPKETHQYYETYLSPVVGMDPQPYGNIKAASADWMLETAVWATANEGSSNGVYGYTDDKREIVPATDIVKNYEKYFGDRTEPSYHTFSDNGTVFEYDSKLKVFYVPLNAITYVFTPKVTKIVRSGDNVTLTVQYLPSSGWTKKPDGTLVAPPPSKTMYYVLKGSNGNYVISAIKNPPLTQVQPSSAVSAAFSDSGLGT
jgi:hypothetical protein